MLEGCFLLLFPHPVSLLLLDVFQFSFISLSIFSLLYIVRGYLLWGSLLSLEPLLVSFFSLLFLHHLSMRKVVAQFNRDRPFGGKAIGLTLSHSGQNLKGDEFQAEKSRGQLT